MDRAWELLGLAVVASIVIVFLNIAYQLSTASGKIDFCHVTEHIYEKSEPYQLIGHRSWRPDLVLAATSTYEQAVEKAKVISCPIKVGP
jgi:hypothetical protein